LAPSGGIEPSASNVRSVTARSTGEGVLMPLYIELLPADHDFGIGVTQFIANPNIYREVVFAQ